MFSAAFIQMKERVFTHLVHHGLVRSQGIAYIWTPFLIQYLGNEFTNLGPLLEMKITFYLPTTCLGIIMKYIFFSSSQFTKMSGHVSITITHPWFDEDFLEGKHKTCRRSREFSKYPFSIWIKVVLSLPYRSRQSYMHLWRLNHIESSAFTTILLMVQKSG